MANSSIYKRNTEVAGRVIDGQAFLVTADNNKLHRLNQQATLLWEYSANGGISTHKAADLLCETFEIDHQTALVDSEVCLNDFVERKIFVTE